MLNKLFLLICLTLPGLTFQAAASEWQTWYELHDKNATPSYEETIRFSKQLAGASPYLHYTTIGTSPQGRDIPLLILDKNQNFSPEKAKASGNKILFIQAAIHPGEPVGKDAGLMLFRDMVIHNKHQEYLENTTILFIPILSVDGHERFGPYHRINQNGPEEMGWRTNALNLNLNRDFLKADSREMRAFLQVWHAWEPDFFIDTHSTNGGDYQYTMTYSMDVFGGKDEGLMQWMEKEYLPAMEEKMEADGYPIFPYVTYRSWHDPRSGLRSGVYHAAFSNGYVSEHNRPGLLLETHMLKPYHLRVESTYLMILHTLSVLNRDNELKNVIARADEYAASEAFRNEKFPLRFELTNDSVMVDFLGVEYTKKQSTLTGGNWFIYDADKPVTYQVPWFKNNVPSYKVNLPEAYIIPVQREDVIDRLAFHNIQMYRLEEEMKVETESYRFKNVNLSSRANEGRQNASFTTVAYTEKRTFPKGSVVIPMAQSRSRLIAQALEPMAPGSFAHWGFFNAIFQRAEYFESYVMEAMAREMLAQDPGLKDRLEEVLEKNPAMRQNPNAILTWFYEQTPYYDQQHNVYPVGRIMDVTLPGM